MLLFFLAPLATTLCSLDSWIETCTITEERRTDDLYSQPPSPGTRYTPSASFLLLLGHFSPLPFVSLLSPLPSPSLSTSLVFPLSLLSPLSSLLSPLPSLLSPLSVLSSSTSQHRMTPSVLRRGFHLARPARHGMSLAQINVHAAPVRLTRKIKLSRLVSSWSSLVSLLARLLVAW